MVEVLKGVTTVICILTEKRSGSVFLMNHAVSGKIVPQILSSLRSVRVNETIFFFFFFFEPKKSPTDEIGQVLV